MVSKKRAAGFIGAGAQNQNKVLYYRKSRAHPAILNQPLTGRRVVHVASGHLGCSYDHGAVLSGHVRHCRGGARPIDTDFFSASCRGPLGKGVMRGGLASSSTHRTATAQVFSAGWRLPGMQPCGGGKTQPSAGFPGPFIG